MKIKNFAFLLAGFFSFAPAYATGEVVVNCSPYGPAGQVVPGWAIIRMQSDLACGSWGRFTWQNLNGYPRGMRVAVCDVGNLPNWWPVEYRSNIGGPCRGGGSYYYIVEYRGN